MLPSSRRRGYGELPAGHRTDLAALVVVKDIEFTCLCEHHLPPFFRKGQDLYLPDGKPIGLSKNPRIVETFARRLQIQERLTAESGETIEQVIHPTAVAVIVEGVHVCAMIRGVKKSGMCRMRRSLRDEFKTDPQLRFKFFLATRFRAVGTSDRQARSQSSRRGKTWQSFPTR